MDNTIDETWIKLRLELIKLLDNKEMNKVKINQIVLQLNTIISSYEN